MSKEVLLDANIFSFIDGFRATIRGVAATSSSYVGAWILQTNGPSTALLVSFFIALLPPVIGAAFVPETAGMRKVDFNEEKKEEKIQRALSMENNEDRSTVDYILMTFSGDQGKQGSNHTGAEKTVEMAPGATFV